MNGGVAPGARLHPILVIGLGMGESLSRSEMERLVASDVLAGGARLLERFAHLPGGRLCIGSPLEQSLDAIAKAREEGGRVAVLADGDPLFFGIGTRLLARFGPEALRFSPGITAVQAACARMGMTWDGLPVVSLHGRTDTWPVLAALHSAGRVAVYTDQTNTPDALARLFLEYGLDDALLHVAQDLGTQSESFTTLSPGQASRMEFSRLNIVVAELTRCGLGRPVPGTPDELYEKQAGLITKWPVRAASLGALGLCGGMTLWDVGAGCGSVGIEACALLPTGRVFAVEREPERHHMVKENARRFGAWQLKAVKGEAPEAFLGLPDPERVFLGGSLGAGTEVLAEAWRRLKPGGRLVANTVLLGSAARAVEHLRALGVRASVTQIQASVSSPLGGDERLAAHNPVFIIAADKPG